MDSGDGRIAGGGLFYVGLALRRLVEGKQVAMVLEWSAE